MFGLGSFFDYVSPLYREGVDTSFDVKMNMTESILKVTSI